MYKESCLLPYETIFMAADVPGGEIMKIFAEQVEVLHPTGFQTASSFTSVCHSF